MNTIAKEYTGRTEEEKEIRQLVMDGLNQIKEGKTKDFNTVCDRLEKQYASNVDISKFPHGMNSVNEN